MSALSWFGFVSLGPLGLSVDLGGQGWFGVTVLCWHDDEIAWCHNAPVVAAMSLLALTAAVYVAFSGRKAIKPT